LNLVGDRLCIGLPDGGLTLYDCKRRQGQTLHLPQPSGKVVAITDGDTIKVIHDGAPESIRRRVVAACESSYFCTIVQAHAILFPPGCKR